ncbi:MAG: hydrogenase maturation nickel metallochaperone HypA [Pseudomonadales bacterium]|uniref:hydrogenase maturation nickel metallochaperone HypA n=1 Tax=unclassified Ketobacter TaxID=2639109 RepID=UPI000C678A33|nr:MULTISPECIES: hydrogenase maturation nickel metallochaperone HypA [unclassified Ketobacter]MAA59489.1 hydrogenase maturation nickel metallochaperone HypA [Pseudomonadales bacterium]MEC8811446.1 hydrogenase maturation nickel metallochaperone HypA [Pseudomonadota bacterium]HAU14120.1 hydrogenase maturation nickel metallochaperone HypA [Gammaproteobacteria bacterium]MAQ23847.1 hydrogenase maturation nickel metallochaperone HypA [Pseudomonadales bacterium]MBI26168.1 hydrogenase maturation nicke|tara:strand:- start:277 stop:618 length:342 start_codon:yes stop_codon:yes gene_type:complete
MHEMSLCESVLQIVEEEAARQRFSKVKWLQLEIGTLAGVEVEAMRFCFDAVSRNSVLEGAALDIVQPVGQAWCMQCAKTLPLRERYQPCPECGGYQLQVTGGDEMRIKELEVE